MYNRFNTETKDIRTMNSNNRIDATLYSVVCLRNVSINTLRKGDDGGDNDDDNNNNKFIS
jgi:hypothetical protein